MAVSVGGIFIATERNIDRRRQAAAVARPHFQRAGLGEPVTIEVEEGLFDYYPKHGRAASAAVRFGQGDFAIAAGTFIFGGQTGQAALRQFWAEDDPVAAVDDCMGHFAVIVRKQGRTRLLRDRHATYELYIDPDQKFISTSFLALAACLPRLTMRAEECLEYVIGGVTLGTGTPIDEIDRLDIGDSVSFDGTPRIARRLPPLVMPVATQPIGEQIERNLAMLRTTMRAYLGAFNNQLRLSFSGGYDSRLLLALARDCGADPHLFVYGSADSPDVRHARQIAEAESVSFEHIEKSRMRPVTLEAFPDMLRNSYEMNDGFSQYWMFCSDSENFARIDRCRGEGILMNGGGGEVFRNFFKFRGQSMSVRDFVRCFFSGFDPAVLADSSLKGRYETRIGGKIVKLLGLERPVLSSAHVQSLYPHLRCRSWFGRDGSLDNRFGFRATPYLEPCVVEAALQVPLRWKHFGVFQGRMIHALAPSLAAHMSSHGYAFDRDPPWRARLSDLRLYAQPALVRQYNFRIKQALARRGSWPAELSPPFLRSVMNASFPVMSRLFHPDRLRDAGQFQRLCVLEYMFQKLGV